MSWGIGTTGDVSFDVVDGSDSWGGPMNGIDVVRHEGSPTLSTSWHGRIGVDAYLFLVIMGALAALWLLGGVLFKNATL